MFMLFDYPLAICSYHHYSLLCSRNITDFFFSLPFPYWDVRFLFNTSFLKRFCYVFAQVAKQNMFLKRVNLGWGKRPAHESKRRSVRSPAAGHYSYFLVYFFSFLRFYVLAVVQKSVRGKWVHCPLWAEWVRRGREVPKLTADAV